MRSGTIVFDEAVATMKSAAQALKSSFQCMNCIVTLHHQPTPQLRRGSGTFSMASVNPLPIASLAGTLHPDHVTNSTGRSHVHGVIYWPVWVKNHTPHGH
jgi:hypothetical protein